MKILSNIDPSIGVLIGRATSKNPPVDADIFGYADSQATNLLKSLTYANLKESLKTYFDTVYGGDLFTIKHQEFTATEGQTLFTLTAGTYTIGHNAIKAYLFGIRQPDSSFTETSTASVTFDVGLELETKVLFEWYEIVNVTMGASAVQHAGTHATVGTDPISPSSIGALPLTGGVLTGTLTIMEVIEKASLVATPFAAGTNINLLDGTILYNTATANANPTFNIRGNVTTSLATMLATGDSITFSILITNTGTPYYPTAYTIDGAAITPKWNGTAPNSGNASAIDKYTFTIVKTAATPTYTMFADRVKYA